MSSFSRYLRLPGIFMLLITSLVLTHSPSTSEPRTFRAAFPLDALRSVTQGDAKVASEILIRKIVEEQGFRYSTAIPETHAEFIPRMKNEEFDFFLIFGYEFLKYRDELGLEPILVGSRTSDSPLNTFVLVTKREKGIAGAKGGVLLVQEGSGMLPHMWLSQKMEENGLDPAEQYFEEVREVSSVSQAVLPVFFGKASAGLVTLEGLETIAELNPQIDQVLEKTFASDPIITSLMCVRKDYPAEDKEIILRISRDLHNRPDGGQILTMMRVTKLVAFETEYMVSLEKLMSPEKEPSGEVSPTPHPAE